MTKKISVAVFSDTAAGGVLARQACVVALTRTVAAGAFDWSLCLKPSNSSFDAYVTIYFPVSLFFPLV